jgi:hypothetical protein
MKTLYLYALATSLIVLLRERIAGESSLEPLTDQELENLTKFALSNPRVAERYHNPSICKHTWLKELEDVIDDLC